MDTNFEKERDEIVDTFIRGVKTTINQVEKLSLRISELQKKRMVSELTALESNIRDIIFSFNAKETTLCCQLIKLYKKYNKPHSLDLEDVIKNKEQDLKAIIGDAKKEVEKLYRSLEQESIDPFILLEFFDWQKTLNFENLKTEYVRLAKNPEKINETESRLRQQIVAALKTIIEKY